jgi:uncharacterized protein (TIGR03067 family)
MKLYSLAAVLLCASLAIGQNTRPADRPADTGKADKTAALEGTWTVLAAEKNGEAMADAKDMTVTVKDGVLTCSCPKTKMTAKMEFTGPGKGRVTILEGKEGEKGLAKEAVYVLTNDYLAVCVHDEKTTIGGEKPPKDTDATIGYQPTTKSQCSFILKRGDRK